MQFLNNLTKNLVVIDEAQAIKNPKTAQAKAVKKMKVPVRIAMSGRLVENRLSEYWSIFDFSSFFIVSTKKRLVLMKDKSQTQVNKLAIISYDDRILN